MLLERQQDLMSVILSKKDMEIGRFKSRQYAIQLEQKVL